MADRVGRLGVQDVTWPLCVGSDELLVVARPRAEELYPVAHRLRAIGDDVRSAGLVLVGERPHSPTEIADRAELGLVLGQVPDEFGRRAGVPPRWPACSSPTGCSRAARPGKSCPRRSRG